MLNIIRKIWSGAHLRTTTSDLAIFCPLSLFLSGLQPFLFLLIVFLHGEKQGQSAAPGRVFSSFSHPRVGVLSAFKSKYLHERALACG